MHYGDTLYHTGHICPGGAAGVAGCLFNWDWFFTAHNTQFIVANAGRNRARLFYAAIGLLMIATGVFFFLSIQGCI